MSGARSVLALALVAPLVAQEQRLLFTGDILLSRQVEREVAATGRSPWEALKPLFARATFVMGNLEGAVGDAAACAGGPCFAIAAKRVALLGEAGFHRVTIANNHARDLGAAGLAATRAAFPAVAAADSPVFLRWGETRAAIVAVSLVAGRDGVRDEVPSAAVAQKLRLARAFAAVVIVSVHWGSELLEWPSSGQRSAARWLVANGADVVVGHHPHVVQAPECVGGRPVYYSLGNHVFDQKYPATKQGLIADCRIAGGRMRCGGIATRTPAGSAFPALAPEADVAALGCEVELQAPRLTATSLADGYTVEGAGWRSRVLPLTSAELATMGGEPVLFTLERHHSPIDREVGLRPYVYQVTRHGLVARWRGSALAWPLVDARLLAGAEGVVCALHRGDSFVAPDPQAKATRVAAYGWNGFGFSGIDDESTRTRCRQAVAYKE
jgi:poly-gamma-glutamate synthesis protein (capsule biosynthesis protein)